MWYQSYSLVLEGHLCYWRVIRGPVDVIYVFQILDIHEGDYQVTKCWTHPELKLRSSMDKIIELWKLKMEDLSVNQEQWIIVETRSIKTSTSKEDSKKLDKKSQSTIWRCLVDWVLLNVSGEDTTKKLWDKLGNLYHLKSIVNKLFL